MTIKCYYEKETTYKAKYVGQKGDGTLVIVYLPLDAIERGECVPKYVNVTVE